MKRYIYEKAKKINSMALDCTGLVTAAIVGTVSIFIIFILVIVCIIIAIKLIHKEYRKNNPIERRGD